MVMKQTLGTSRTDVSIGRLLNEVKRAADTIRQRAYELAVERRFTAGRDLDDWLKAEKELFFVPASELSETPTEYVLSASVSGFEPDQVAVAVEPHSVTVWGKAATSREDAPQAGAASELGSREMFCRYRLPHAVVVETAKAVYAAEVLTVTLPKHSSDCEADSGPAAACLNACDSRLRRQLAGKTASSAPSPILSLPDGRAFVPNTGGAGADTPPSRIAHRG